MKKRKITEIPIPLQTVADGHPLRYLDYLVEIYDGGIIIKEKRASFGPFIDWQTLANALRVALVEGGSSSDVLPLFAELVNLSQRPLK